MLESRVNITFTIWIAVVAFTFYGLTSSNGQSPKTKNRDVELVNRNLSEVDLEGQINHVFATLSLGYDIPIGIEVSPSESNDDKYHLEMKDGTVVELMNQFTAQNNRYEWFIEDGVLNVFPRQENRDAFLSVLLASKIDFVVKPNTDTLSLETLLGKAPEVKALSNAYGLEPPTGFNFSGLYIPRLGRDFSLSASQITIKKLLNRVARESPLARFWRVSRYENTFSFAITSLQEENKPNSHRVTQ